MSYNIAVAVGNAMSQAVAEFDGSPQKVAEMCDLARIVRYFAIVEFPHPDTPKILARYTAVDEWPDAELQDAVIGQKRALLDLIELADLTGDDPAPGAVFLLHCWYALRENQPLPAQAALVLDPSVPVNDRIKNLALLGYPLS